MLLFLESVLASLTASLIFEVGTESVKIWHANKSIEYFLRKAFNKAVRKYSKKNQGAIDYHGREHNKYYSALKGSLFVNGFDFKKKGQKELLTLFEKEVQRNPILKWWLSFEYKKHNTSQLNDILIKLDHIITVGDKANVQLEGIREVVDKIGRQVGLPDVISFTTSQSNGEDLIFNHISKRVGVIHTIQEKLKEKNCIVLFGTKSIGKTTVIKLLLQELPTSEIIRIDCEYRENIDLQAILSQHNKISKGTYVLIDSMLLGANDITIKNFEYISQICKKGANVIIASYNQIPREFLPISLDFTCEIDIPLLTENEIEEVLTTYNAPTNLKRTIYLFSSGHPIIVNALCLYLQKNNWAINDSTFAGIISYDHTLQIQNSLSSLLEVLIPDAVTRELLNRLLVINGNITPANLNIVANINPPINEPNRRFNILKPFWLTQTSEGSYNISRLLKSAWHPDLLNITKVAVNRELGLNLISTKALNQQNLSEALLYLINGEEYDLAGTLYLKYLSFLSEQDNPLSNHHIVNSFWIDLPLPQNMNIDIKIAIRIQQAFIFKDRSKGYIKDDLLRLMDSHKGDSFFKSFYYRSISIILLMNEDITQSLEYYRKSILLGGINMEGMKPPEEMSLMNSGGIWMLLFKIDNIEDFTKWTELCSAIDERDIVIDDDIVDFCCSFIDRYVNAKEEASPEIIIAELYQLLALIEHNKSLEMLSIIIQNKIIYLTGTSLNNIDRAVELYNTYIQKYSTSITATILFNQSLGDIYNIANDLPYHDEAVEYYKKVIEIEDSALLVYNRIRVLIMLSSLIGDKNSSESIEFINKAYPLLEYVDALEDITKCELIGEHAIALWANNDRVNSIKKLAEGYGIIHDTFLDDSDVYKAILLIYGTCIGHYSSLIADRAINPDFVIPHRGMFLKNREKTIDLYAPEKKYALAQMLFSAFDDLLLFDSANNWVHKILAYKKNFPTDYPFYGLFLQFVPYLAKEMEFEEIDSIYYLTEESRRQMIEKGMNFTIPNENESDNYLTIFILPCIFVALDEYLKEKAKGVELGNVIIKLLRRHSAFVADNAEVNIFEDYFSRFICGEKFDRNTIIAINELSSDYYAVKILGYILTSISVDVKYSFEIQFAFLPSYDDKVYRLFGESSYLFLTSFFERYWTDSLTRNTRQFESSEHLSQRGLALIEQKENRERLKTIFKVFQHHIGGLRTNADQDAWCGI